MIHTLRRLRPRTASLLAASALLVAACGSSGSGTASPTEAPVRLASIEVAVPDLMVHDLQAGGQKPLRSVLAGEQPILFWFWAPH